MGLSPEKSSLFLKEIVLVIRLFVFLSHFSSGKCFTSDSLPQIVAILLTSKECKEAGF